VLPPPPPPPPQAVRRRLDIKAISKKIFLNKEFEFNLINYLLFLASSPKL
jgi:hypothetical protein